MSYRVSIDAFEGPFDLLLHLVARQKVDIGAISILDISDQYLSELDRMRDLDLDIASDFLLVASTLLEIKASSLLPKEDVSLGEEFDDLSPEVARDILIERLIVYKQFKNVAFELAARQNSEGRMHPRQAGLEPEFLDLIPDYLEGITLRGLAVICADLAQRREVFLLEAEHVASMPISLELHVESVHRSVAKRKNVLFSQLLANDDSPEIVVVTFLAILELYKRNLVTLDQDTTFGDIRVRFVEEGDRLEPDDMSPPSSDSYDEDEVPESAPPEESPVNTKELR